MNDRLSIFARRYVAALRKFATAERAADLERAYELGRKAMEQKLGVLDLARVHQNALAMLLPSVSGTTQQTALRATGVFFLESLSPFEATHRGFRNSNHRLHRLVAGHERRNQGLSDINSKLTKEIRRRKLTEKALRQNERHFRKLFNEARAMEEGLRSLSNQMLDVQECERKRISRELHDETGQALTAISVTLASLSRNGQASQTRQRMLRDAQRLLQATMEALHNFARELRPAVLDELGLLPALRSYLKAFSERTGLRVWFRANSLAETLGASTKIVLFRVAQESLTNIAKHAQASRVDVRIRKEANRICMIIVDDGKSFAESPEDFAERKQGLGLLGMQERVRLVNGQFTIRPQPGKGTTVNVAVPLNLNGASRRF